MATDFATDPLKTVMSKVIADTAPETTTADSPVAEFRSHQPLHHDPQPNGTGESTASSGATDSTTHPTATLPTLSDSAVAELKAAYTAVEQAISDAKTDATTTTPSSGTTSTASGTTSDTAAGTADDKTAHQPPVDPLVKILTDATGESTATVQGVLQQIQAVLHQEHRSDSAGAPSSTDTASTTTTASTGTADTTAGDAPSHWHDRLAAQSGSSAETASGTATAGTDDAGALWRHHLVQHTAVDSAVTTNADVVSAVDDFSQTVQTLHLDPMHGHGVDGAHLDSAA